MSNNKSCKKCGSNKIIQEVKIIDFSHGNIKRNLSVEIYKTKGFFNKKNERSEIISTICGNCGNCGKMELYAKNYEKLWNIYNNEK